MTDGGSDFEFDHFFGKKTERPTVSTIGRIAESQGDDIGFLFAIKEFRSWWCRAFLAVQGDVEPFGDESLSYVFDALACA